MVERTLDRTITAAPLQFTDEVISNHALRRSQRTDVLKRFGHIGSAAFLTYSTFFYGDTAGQMITNVQEPLIKARQVQAAEPLIHNNLIAIEPPVYLPGLFALQYKTQEDEWEGYNVVVPNVVANGIEVSAEIFSAKTHTTQIIDENGDTNFEIAYEKFDGIRFIDGHLAVGNGAHFKIVGTMPKDKKEVTMQIVPEEDSAPIERASLGNYFGAVKNVNEVDVHGQGRYYTKNYPAPNDGNMEQGDFYTIPVSSDAEVAFGNVSGTFVQRQIVNQGDELDIEIRSHHWRPELGNERQNPWVETVRVWQRFDGEKLPQWTFSWGETDR